MTRSGPMGKSVRDMKRLYNIVANKPAIEKKLNDLVIEMLPSEQPYPISLKTSKMLIDVQVFLSNQFTIIEEMPPYFDERSEERRVGKKVICMRVREE